MCSKLEFLLCYLDIFVKLFCVAISMRYSLAKIHARFPQQDQRNAREQLALRSSGRRENCDTRRSHDRRRVSCSGDCITRVEISQMEAASKSPIARTFSLLSSSRNRSIRSVERISLPRNHFTRFVDNHFATILMRVVISKIFFNN